MDELIVGAGIALFGITIIIFLIDYTKGTRK
jgi:hypothetical protein